MAKRILLAGATGTVGRAVCVALLEASYEVTCLVRPGRTGDLPKDVHAIEVAVTDPGAIGALDVKADAIVSCLASRTGSPADAWAVDHAAHLALLDLSKKAGAEQFVLLSAICVQKPKLQFQHAKLAFETVLQSSGLAYSIVRPTALFKSLSGQVGRLRAGKPFLVFGDGQRTACKPISDADLADYIVNCLSASEMQNRVLPIGGPGPALTPLDQGRLLYEALGVEPKFRRVPFALMDAIVGGLSLVGHVSQRAADNAERARIGRYYARESMLVWDADRGQYDADATPETGRDTLAEFYRKLAAGRVSVDLGDHAVF